MRGYRSRRWIGSIIATAFQWDRRTLRLPSASQQRFFAEAAKFGIQSGATVTILGGFGRFAAFTVAGNRDASLEHRPIEIMDMLQRALSSGVAGLPNDGSRPPYGQSLMGAKGTSWTHC
ncbi:MAG: hypothetical protein E5X86_25420 [Mesorhizobium sp.]|uniref:autoinducer binding domain-containing protein n=1 Tax=Mesorhizobium sp. TaxID=1871066 RepID=UPI001203D58A|nr:MAG: hypothetical protein E5X86_25420 [Mesorhizobium sp.]